MKKLNELQNTLLKLLYSSYGKLDSYTLFKRSRVSFSEFTKALIYLINKNYITDNDHVIQLTDQGIANIYNNFSPSEVSKKWREIPTELKLEKMDANDLYIPSASLLDEKTFKLKQNEVD